MKAATIILFNDPKVIRKEVLEVALHKLIRAPTIPRLFMHTLMLAMNVCPPLTQRGVATRILIQLVKLRIWEHDDLWRGFLICCKKKEFAPHSLPALAQLPKKQLEKAFEKAPSLFPALSQLARTRPALVPSFTRSLLNRLEMTRTKSAPGKE